MKQLISGAAVIVLSILVWLRSRAFPQLPDGHPGPGLFPMIVAGGLLLCGIILTFAAIRSPEAPRGAEGDGLPGRAGSARIGVVLFAVAAYPVLSPLIGFVPTIGATSFLVALLLQARVVPSALTALGGTLVIYLLFTGVLGVPL